MPKPHPPLKTRKRLTKGGSRNTLPLPATYSDFLKKWSLYYIVSHGNITEKMCIVPENTYILNTTTAGKPCNKLRWHMDNWIYNEPDGFTSPTRTVSQKMYAAIKDETFLRNTSIEHMYTSGNDRLNQNIGDERNTISFYEPGDIMFNTELNIFNTTYPLSLMGVYSIPIPYKYRSLLFTKNRSFYNNDANILGLSENDLIPNVPTRMATKDDQQMFNTTDNLIQELMFTKEGTPLNSKIYLCDLISYINTKQRDEKIHLYIVSACRSIRDNKISLSIVRRLSIATRGDRPLVRDTKRFRSQLNEALLQKIRTRLKQIKSETFSDKLHIQTCIDILTNILTTKQTTVNEIKDVFDIAKKYLPFQAEFIRLLP